MLGQQFKGREEGRVGGKGDAAGPGRVDDGSLVSRECVAWDDGGATKGGHGGL